LKNEKQIVHLNIFFFFVIFNAGQKKTGIHLLKSQQSQDRYFNIFLVFFRYFFFTKASSRSKDKKWDSIFDLNLLTKKVFVCIFSTVQKKTTN